MNTIHAHEVLRMMEGGSYSKESLKQAIINKFGVDTHFYTCSAQGLNADEIIEFLFAKGKFKTTERGFTMDIDKVCKDY